MQNLIKIVFGKICKMTIKGVKLKSESFFSIFYGVLELWRETLSGLIEILDKLLQNKAQIIKARKPVTTVKKRFKEIVDST